MVSERKRWAVTRLRKTWMILLIATALALTISASVGAVLAPLPAPPASPSVQAEDSGHPTTPSLSDSLEASVVEGGTRLVASAVTVSARVEAARLLVLDDQGDIVEVWSNTGDLDLEPRLSARLDSVDGPLLTPIPRGALDEYRILVEQVDWSVRGLVYAAD